MKTLTLTFLLLIIVFTSDVSGQNQVINNDYSKWGYYLQIVDSSYIPQIVHRDTLGYVTLYTGISEYDEVFARYKITDFYQSFPTAATEILRQVYSVVCDSGQFQLGIDLVEGFSNVVIKVSIFYHNPIGKEVTINNDSEKPGQRGNLLWLGRNNGLSKTVSFYDINGRLIHSTQTFEDTIDPSFKLPIGLSVYIINVEGNTLRGLYFN